MGKSSGSQTQKTEPWSGQQPYLQQGFQQAQNLYNSGGPQYYPNATYTPFSSQTEQGLGMLQNRALQGSPVEQGMQSYVTGAMQNPGGQMAQNTGGYLTDVMKQAPTYFGGRMGSTPHNALSQTASGSMLNSNPYLDQMYNNAASRVTENFTDAVIPSLNASFSGAGGSGSGIQRELAMDASRELGDSLGMMAGNLYGDNFARERGFQMNAANAMNADDLARRGMNQNQFQYSGNQGLQAAGLSNQLMGTQGDIARGAAALAPTASQFDYNNINNLLGVGQAVEGKAGEALQDSMGRFNYYQNLPEDNLARYIAAIQGNYGSTTSSKASGNPIAGAAGGALTANALSGIGGLGWLGGPWGALGGAVLGGLLS